MALTPNDPSSRILHSVAVLWFWLTITGVFYVGLGHVLPAVYAEYSTAFFVIQHTLCYFMFIQMIVNWLCVKIIKSPFKPEDHMEYLCTHAELIANGGYEINLNHLTEGPQSNTYKLPVSSINTMNGEGNHGENQLGGKTMYIMPLPDEPPQNIQVLCNGTNGKCSSTRLPSKRVIYPYWSWKPCVICQCQRPPRAHHCPLCQSCVLKRDHHCFFTGSCIGLLNQRHFVVFSFWAAVATSYCMLHSVLYLFVEFLPNHSLWDIFIPVTVIRWALGYIPMMSVGMIILLYSLVFFCLTSIGFFAEQMRHILKGVTSFEVDNNIKITNCNSKAENLRGVFGDYWHWNFLVPLHHVYPTLDNGISWTGIKL